EQFVQIVVPSPTPATVARTLATSPVRVQVHRNAVGLKKAVSKRRDAHGFWRRATVFPIARTLCPKECAFQVTLHRKDRCIYFHYFRICALNEWNLGKWESHYSW